MFVVDVESDDLGGLIWYSRGSFWFIQRKYHGGFLSKLAQFIKVAITLNGYGIRGGFEWHVITVHEYVISHGFWGSGQI